MKRSLPIHYIDRVSGRQEVEKIYGEVFLRLIYGDDIVSRALGPVFLHLLVKYSFFSRLYGFWQRTRWSKSKIRPFIDAFDVDADEFLASVESFRSFNDFFIRKLKPKMRPIAQGDDVAVIPADGRYLLYPEIHRADGFVVKGRKFSLGRLLDDDTLAARYAEGSMVIARLAPQDYHRFHFPCDGVPTASQLIGGWLYSVNPIAIWKRPSVFTENKRWVCTIDSPAFGTVTMVEVGATNVGSVHQTYSPGQPCSKGDEKGYFSFGGSSIVILFEPGKIVFSNDLIDLSRRKAEIRCLIGQHLGCALS